MKLRFSALDVAAECQELKRLQGYRLQNIYDINPKTYLLKFSQKEDKELVLVESGIRIHYTEFTRDKSNMPNGFCIKLRKHLRTKRLYSVKQVGFDRVVDFQFGQDEYAFHLIMEFYASGNIILTDHEYKILTLLRVFDDTSNDTKTAVGQIYSFNVRSLEPMNSERLLYALGQDLKGKKKKDSLLKALLKQEFVAYYGSNLLDYAIRDFQNIDPEQIIANSDLLESILGSFQRVDEIINSCCTNPQKGVIQTDDGAKTYLDFLPFNLDFSGETYKEFESFGKCVDEYFSKLEAQKLQAKALQAENLANKKYESAKAAHENQIKGFELAEHTKMLYARAIEHNIEFVDSVLQSVRALLATGIDWEDLKQLVREEQAEGNMIAIAIVGWKLEVSVFTIALKNIFDENGEVLQFEDSESDSSVSDETEETPDKPSQAYFHIDLNVHLGAHANARNYFIGKKIASSKAEKTRQVATKALEHVQKKIEEGLAKNQQQLPSITKIRKQYWFEKFMWFISTENYLVVAGRDEKQNEILVKRYLKPGDAYVHADMHGAASVIVKNMDSSSAAQKGEIPASTLLQAGTMSVCQSRAWDAKIVTSAYWVHAHQVSKSAPTGEYLTSGSFMIRGKKQWLPPIQLLYGIAILFKVDEESVARHFYDRRPWLRNIDGQLEQTKDKPESTQAEEQTQLGKTLDAEEFPDTRVELDDEEILLDEDNASDPGAETYQSISAIVEPFEQPLNVIPETINQKKHSKVSKAPQRPVPEPPKKKGEVRGKSRKLKKQAKYAHQDDEDRELMQALLSSSKGPQPKGKKAKAKAAMEAEREARQKHYEEQKAKQSNKNDDDLAANQQELYPLVQIQETIVSESNEMHHAEIRSKDSIEQNEQAYIAQILSEENIGNLDEEQQSAVTNLDALVANPHVNDILLHAIPVAAPWITLQKYKYKIKIQPGSQKRGKAVSQAISIFLKQSETEATEKELIKSITDPEWMVSMLSKVKLGTQADGKPKKNK